MTPEQAFKSGGQHPITGWRVRDWYGFVSVFTQARVMNEGAEIIGLRQVVAKDMASGYVMAFDALPEQPGTLRCSRLIPFIDRVCGERGQPIKGIVISHSCWFSSLELEIDEDTAEQGEFLREFGIEFAPMPDTDKEEIRAWGAAMGLAVLFDADQIPQMKKD